jgi:hypothetical protein
MDAGAVTVYIERLSRRDGALMHTKCQGPSTTLSYAKQIEEGELR